MLKVLIFGDSLADGLKIEGTVCDVVSRWGETTVALMTSFPTLEHCLQESKCDIVILVAGSNDLANDALPMYAIDNLLRMHRQCRRFGTSFSIGVSLLHDHCNEQYTERCRMAKIPVCQFLHEDVDTNFIADDGIHLNELGKSSISSALLITIRENLVKQTLPDLQTAYIVLFDYIAQI